MKTLNKLMLSFVTFILLQQTSFAVMESYAPGAIQNEIQKEFIDSQIEKNFLQKPIETQTIKKKKSFEDIKNETKTNDTFNPTFKLNNIIIKGNTVYKKKELDKLISPLLGKDVQIKDIMNITEIITRKYNYDGYITSYAYIPEQNVIDGFITIKLSKVK